MNPTKIIRKYYEVDSKLYRLLVEHNQAVEKKSIEIAKGVSQLNPDLQFIEEVAMLHDIGIYLTDAPDLKCFGKKPYICHGYLGREIVEKEGLLKHALVCERHVGVGITIKEIESRNLPLPKRDMRPVTIEEEIICCADKYFSKSKDSVIREKSVNEIREGLQKFGEDKVQRFNEWMVKFSL